MWHLFEHICMYFGIIVLFMGLKRDCIGWMMMVNGVGWFDGLVEWFHRRKRQIHQQCSCPISGQGVLICSEASIHSAHQYYFLTSHTPTAPHQCSVWDRWRKLKRADSISHLAGPYVQDTG